MRSMPPIDYELCDLGIDYPDYFQGFGIAFTRYDHCVLGCGDTPREAIADALEQIASAGDSYCGIDADDLARQIAEDEGWQIDDRGEVLAPDSPNLAEEDADEPESEYGARQYYVGIRWNPTRQPETPQAPPCPPPPGFNLDAYRLESGKVQSYAWPGGYPIFYLTADNGVLCPDCANDNLELITDPDEPQWQIVAADVNWEDTFLICDNCYKLVESAYGSPDETDTDNCDPPPPPPAPDSDWEEFVQDVEESVRYSKTRKAVYERRSHGVHPIVRQIVNRCHVGTRVVDVLRYFISRLEDGHYTWRKHLTREQRRDYVRQVCWVHRNNRQLYREVMR